MAIARFMKKLDSLVPDIEKMSISLESLKKIIRRKGLAEEQSEKDGVNGFYQYKDAIDKENSGFDIPEILDDLIYAELSGDFPLGDSRQPTYKSLRPFDLVS